MDYVDQLRVSDPEPDECLDSDPQHEHAVATAENEGMILRDSRVRDE